MPEEKPKSALMSVLVGIGCLILAVVLIAASVVWGFEKVIQFIGVVIVTAVFGFATRKFWSAVFSSFENFKRAVVISSISALVLYLLFWVRKLMNLALADTTPISPSITILLLVMLGFGVTKFISDPERDSNLMRSLFIFCFSGAYVVFGGMIGVVENWLWFEMVACGSVFLWFTLGGLKKSIWYIENGPYATKSLQWYLKQGVWMLVFSTAPFVVPVMFLLLMEEANWWKMGSIIFTYFSLFYLVWVVWIGKYFKYFLHIQKP